MNPTDRRRATYHCIQDDADTLSVEFYRGVSVLTDKVRFAISEKHMIEGRDTMVVYLSTGDARALMHRLQGMV